MRLELPRLQNMVQGTIDGVDCIGNLSLDPQAVEQNFRYINLSGFLTKEMNDE
jgi:hypothetical protein